MEENSVFFCIAKQTPQSRVCAEALLKLDGLVGIFRLDPERRHPGGLGIVPGDDQHHRDGVISLSVITRLML